MDSIAPQINARMLPRLLRDIADIIGLDAALKLVRAYSGLRLYIPERAHAGHPVAQIIGVENLQKLANIYGRENLSLPKIDAADRQIKHHTVHALRASGIPVKHVARETGYTERRIYQLEREGDDDNQPDLFEP